MARNELAQRLLEWYADLPESHPRGALLLEAAKHLQWKKRGKKKLVKVRNTPRVNLLVRDTFREFYEG